MGLSRSSGERAPRHNIDTYDPGKFTSLLYEINTAEVYHFGLQGRSSVGHEMREFSGDITGLSASTILEAIEKSGIMCRFCHASSGEIFGSTLAPQREATPFHPNSP